MNTQPQTCYECRQALNERMVDRIVTVGEQRQLIRVTAWVCPNNHQFFPPVSTRAIDALRAEMKAARAKATA